MSAEPLRDIPSVDRLLSHPAGQALATAYSRTRVADVVREVLAEARDGLRVGMGVPPEDALLAAAAARLEVSTRPVLPRVVNATGICLHTNLGRASYAEPAIEAMVRAARHPVPLELDLETGRRGRRDSVVEKHLLALTGGEAALVVNNNAAAVLLTLAALASGREVVVSRGELVEIGGSFRMPDVMAASGCRLREVGTTNRTHGDDYRRAIGPETALLMKVHPSNFAVVGFTASVSLSDLVGIGRDVGVPVVEDLGSGALVDLTSVGVSHEPTVRERIAEGVDLVLFSGDKLLGGPQAGMIVGKRNLVDRLSVHPLRRALRPDKTTLAALGATLQAYLYAPDVLATIPTLRWLARPMDRLEAIGSRVVPRLEAALGDGYTIEIVVSEARAGAGSAPTRSLESRAIAVSHPSISADAIAARFRSATTPVIGRIHEGRFLLDLRGVDQVDDLVPERL